MVIPLLILIILVLFIAGCMRKSVAEITGHWQHYFMNITYSSDEFYDHVEQVIEAQAIPGVSIDRITYSEGSFFSANRLYLRIRRGSTVFDVCAAPFATGYFISSWQGQLPSLWKSMLGALPIIGESLGKSASTKTYYQVDTQQMFISLVHNDILEVIDGMTTEKGVRGLTELDRQFKQVGKYGV